jgi:ligand-binding sensor domain-containing protein/signal transduction histidine kinase
MPLLCSFHQTVDFQLELKCLKAMVLWSKLRMAGDTLRAMFPAPATLRTALCVAILCIRAVSAQQPGTLSHQSWSTEDGLPQSSVHDILQGSDGYLWIATEGGLGRFDGTAFRIFDRASESAFYSDDICCLVEISDKREFWIGSSDGLLRRSNDRDGDHFKRYSTAEGLAGNAILALTVRDNTLYAQSTAGWSRWNGQRFEPSAFAPLQTWAVAGTALTVSEGGAHHTWQLGRELPAGRVNTTFVDRQGTTWIGTNRGLYTADASSDVITRVASLNGNSILSLFEDREGNHWVGTETSGLHVLRQLRFRQDPAVAGQPVTAGVQTSSGAIWVGTRDEGLRRLQGGTAEQPIAEKTLTSPTILCIAPAANDGLWVGTPDGLNLVHFDSGRTSVRQITSADGLPDDDIRSIAAAPDGSVWIGTRRGLAHITLGESKPAVRTLTTKEGLGGNLIGALLMTRDGLWAVTSAGLGYIANDGRITNFSARDGLPGHLITALAQDNRGTLWVATEDGTISTFDGHRFAAATHIADAVAESARVEGMLVDRADSLWLRMELGIRRISLDGLRACISKSNCALTIASYGLADGLPNTEVAPESYSLPWLTHDGDVWFPTRGGAAVAESAVRSGVSPPSTVLEQFSVDDKPLPLTGAEFSAGRSRVTVEYAGLSFIVPSEVRYRFMLEGFDTQWTNAGSRRAATYTSLPSGHYRFRVQAMSNEGVWGPEASVAFRVIPPFYRRWWFILLGFLLLCTLLAGGYLLRLRSLRRRFDAVLAERNRMAREIHDTLTQDFVGTSLQLDILHQHLKSGRLEKAIEEVKRTRRLVTEGLDEARRSIWELRANQSQASLPTRLGSLIQRANYAAIAPRLNVGGAYHVLDARVEREVLRVAQEALTNVLHHARATETNVSLRYRADSLELIVRDNGRGFSLPEAAHLEGHFGLIGMRERTTSIGGTLNIASQPGSGTTVTLEVPLEGLLGGARKS